METRRNMKFTMSILKGGYQYLNNEFQSQFKERTKSVNINFKEVTKDGFNVKGYLIRTWSWKSLVKTMYMDKIGILRSNMTIKQLLDTSPMDKYLIKMWNQLFKYAKAGEKEKFVKLYRILLKRSFALRLHLFTYVSPKWMTWLSYRKVRVWFRSLDWNLKLEEPFFKYKRIEIQKKGTEELRPLSVPDLVSRCLARAQYEILNCWVEGQGLLDEKYYGTRRKAGSSAAWKYIFERIIKTPNIWEFDFSRYYNSINVVNLQKAMHRLEIPGEIVGWVAASLCVSQESLRHETWVHEQKELLAKTKLWSLEKWLNAEWWLKTSPYKYLVRCIPGLRNYLNVIMQVNTTGIPQGHALGPLLSALYIAPYIKEFDKKMIIYIDDGILFGEKPEVEKFKRIMENLEIKISEEKSKWVKRDGEWECNLKYLGIEYNPFKNRFENWEWEETGKMNYASMKNTDGNLGMNYWRMIQKDCKLDYKTWNKLISFIYNPDPNNWNAYKMQENLRNPKESSFQNKFHNWKDLRKRRTKGIRIMFTTIHSDIYGYIMFRNKL